MGLMTRVIRARTMMMISLPFIASAVMMLDVEFDESVETAETDGEKIYANPNFISPLSNKQLMWLLAHEALHCVLLHHTRVGARDFKLWNVAADYVINLILDSMIEFEFIPGCLLDRTYIDMSTEEVYNIINHMNPKQKQKLKDNHIDAGGFRKASTGTKKDNKNTKSPELTNQEEKWQIFTKQAMGVAEKMGGNEQGFGSAFLKRMIQDIVDPVLPWTQLLWIFVDKRSNDDYDWNRPNPRYVSQGYYFPSRYSEELGYIVVVIDTSGSISATDLSRFSAEINSIKQTYKCRVLVIYCDSRVIDDHVQEFDEYEEVNLEIIGGGGTDFRPPFKYLDRTTLDDNIACMLYFTDGLGSFPEKEPDFPVMWIGTRKFKPPFGEFVFIESFQN